MEYITIPFRELKLADPGADGAVVMSFSGYGAAFGNVDSYGDVIAPGAFAQFLSDVERGLQPWPSMLSQHGGMGLTSEDLTPIGAWLSLSEDGKGLISAGELAKTQRGTEMHTLMSMKPRPAIDGLSIGYVAKKFDPRTKPEEPRRTLREIVLYEISPVTFPANGKARVQAVKSGLTIREAERSLRDAGFSRSEAKAILASGFKASEDLRDAVDDADELAGSLSQLLNKLKA